MHLFLRLVKASYNFLVVMSEAVKLLLFVVILVGNSVFLVYWIFLIYKDLKEMILLKYTSKLAYILCLCVNKGRLEELREA